MKTNIKNYIQESIVVNIFIVFLFSSIISNYQPYSFILKGLGAITVLAVIIYERKKITPTDKISGRTLFKKLSPLAIFTGWLIVSLLYSSNVSFGILKLVNLFLSMMVAIAVVYHLLLTLTSYRLKIILHSLIGWSILFTLVTLIFRPFSFEDVYSFTPGRFSHVMVSRIIGISVLILALAIGYVRQKKLKGIMALTIFMALPALFLTGSRGIFIPLVIMLPLFTVFGYVEAAWKRVAFVIILLLTGTVIFLNGNFSDRISERYETLFSMDKDELIADGSLGGRIQAIDISLELISEHPVTGIGTGGFKDLKEGEDVTDWMQYPHNILLESLAENGIAGFALLCWVIIIILKEAYRVSWRVLLFLIFTLFLAMISKDIPTNTFFFAGYAFALIESRKFVLILEVKG